MTNSIYEDILCGMPRDKIMAKHGIDMQTLNDIASTKIEYDALSPQEKDKVLHTLSLISNKGWEVLERCPMELKPKVLDLLRRIVHDRSEILGLTKADTNLTGSIEISWKKDP